MNSQSDEMTIGFPHHQYCMHDEVCHVWRHLDIWYLHYQGFSILFKVYFKYGSVNKIS